MPLHPEIVRLSIRCLNHVGDHDELALSASIESLPSARRGVFPCDEIDLAARWCEDGCKPQVARGITADVNPSRPRT